MLFFKFLCFIQDRFCVKWSKILTASTEACSGRPIALGSTRLASFRHSITRSFARRLTNLQIIGFGPRSLLLGTRLAVSISSIDTSVFGEFLHQLTRENLNRCYFRGLLFFCLVLIRTITFTRVFINISI